MVTFVVSNINHSDNLNHQKLLNKLSATIKNKQVLLFVIIANNYGVTTYLNFLSIDNFCSIKFNYFDCLGDLEFLTASSHLQKQKTINFSTQIQNYFLTSFSWAVVTFVVPNLSHSDYINLPVTVDNKLLAIKKKDQSYFFILVNKRINTLCAYIRFSEVVIALLVLTTGGSWQLTSRTLSRKKVK